MKANFISITCLSILTLLFALQTQGQIKQGDNATNPPFEGVDDGFQTWNHNPQTCGKFVYSRTGTSICVPADALVHQDGKPVTGQVTVKYREFHSPLTVLVSGINMRYTENGQDQHLETGGMYELRIYQNGQPLELMEGMQANVKMRSYANRQDYDFFQYQDENGEWKKLNSGGTRIDETPAPVETAEMYWGDDLDSEQWVNNEDGPFSDWGWGEWESEIDTSWHQIDEFANSIFYSGTITELGIYNYDAILKKEPIVQIPSQFFVPNNADREHIRVYVVYKDINSVFYFNPYDWKEKFYLYTDRPAKIFAVLPGNKIAMYPEDALAQLDLKKMGGKPFIWQMEDPANGFSSLSAIQDYLQIN